MNFRTVVDIPALTNQIGYDHKLLFMGSCFTTHIGERMQMLKFPALVNPFGVVYNPASIMQNFGVLLSGQNYAKEDLFFHKGLWANFAHHSSFSSPDADECLMKINSNKKHASAFLREADFLFITLGTARAFRYKKTGEIVSNCHKLPAAEFEQVFLSLDEITDNFSALFTELKGINPRVQVIFSVSPIRHWKDGAHGNQLSKANLLLAVDRLVNTFDYVHYFPAYEIMMDELRDYRFYADDMLHPSSMAIDYIWEKFQQSCIKPDALQIIPRIERVRRAMNHRPFQEDTAEYRAFLLSQVKELEAIQKHYSFLDLKEEQAYFSSKIKDEKKGL